MELFKVYYSFNNESFLIVEADSPDDAVTKVSEQLSGYPNLAISKISQLSEKSAELSTSSFN